MTPILRLLLEYSENTPILRIPWDYLETTPILRLLLDNFIHHQMPINYQMHHTHLPLANYSDSPTPVLRLCPDYSQMTPRTLLL